MTTRITTTQLYNRADTATTLARKLGIITDTECIRIAGAYGGTRCEVTGDVVALTAKYGEPIHRSGASTDRVGVWPEGWSSVRFLYGMPQGYDTKRQTYDYLGALIGTLDEVRRATEAVAR